MYKCNKCGYEKNKYFGLCPSCREGMGEEIFISSSNSSNSNNNQNNIKIEFKKVDPNAEKVKASIRTKYKNFNSILSTDNGFVDGQVVLLGAKPGIGKSTLCISIADSNTLYISSEENFTQVNDRALRVNPDCNCDILNSTDYDEVCEAIRQTDKKLIIIDSLNSINFGVGYLTTAKYANGITNIIKECNKIAIIISQVSKSGEITGMESLIHVVDTVLYLERSEVSSNVIATSTKNRYGEIGEISIFKHNNEGLYEIEMDYVNMKKEIGSTYTKTRFGHKNMTISIEALVSSAQSSYGLRSINGYNRNRVIQLIGILSYFGKFDLSSKDIYVSISNGLSTDDISIELAMANSILSSLYNKTIVTEAYGEVRLNGRIVDGLIDGEKIDHINDLIQRYK